MSEQPHTSQEKIPLPMEAVGIRSCLVGVGVFPEKGMPGSDMSCWRAR